MEALYHGNQSDAMPCARNRAAARLLVEDNTVMVKLNDTARIAGYGVIPLADYVKRYVWTNSRLRGR